MAHIEIQTTTRRLLANLKRHLATILLKKVSLKPLLTQNPYNIDGPQDKIEFSVSGLRPSLYFIRIIQRSNESLAGPRLVTVSRNRKESHENIYIFVTLDESEFYGTVLITEDIESLAFYPSRLPVSIEIENCYLRSINRLSRDYIYGQTYVRIRSFGLAWTINKIIEETQTRLQRLIKGGTNDSYATWWELHGKPSQAALSEQKRWSALQSETLPTISIVMPVYETPLKLLEKAINSVLNQSYPNWELCIADDASNNPDLLDFLGNLEKSEKRIKVVYRQENGHISAASNSALELACGEFVGFLDHDDELGPNALYEVVQAITQNPSTELLYSDEDVISEDGLPLYPQLKPDWNPDFARSINYVCHFMVLRRERITQLGGFRVGGYEGAQDFDLMLRITENLNANRIQHIPKVLYHWRAAENSSLSDHSNKDYSTAAGVKALSDHIQRMGLNAEAEASEVPTAYRVHYKVSEPPPSATIIVPTYNNLRVLRNCIDSVLSITDYPTYEILIIDNCTTDTDALEYLQSCQGQKVRVIRYEKAFNFSAINNYAVSQTSSDFVVLLNNDTEACNRDWLTELLSQASRPEVGAVGAKLFYPQDLIQHAGVLLGMGPDRVAGHALKGAHKDDTGPMGRLRLVQAYSAVTGACLAVSRDKYLEVGGLDEEHLAIAFNDVDFCLKLREKGYINIWTPYAQLYHYESYSRGYDHSDTSKRERFMSEASYMHKRWGKALLTDPYYNPNLTRDFNNFSLAWPPNQE